MSRSRTFLINAASASGLQLATIIAGFIVPRILLTTYGSETNGLVTSITQFIAYFNLVEAGLASVAVFSLYGPLAKKNYEGINAILSASRNFYNKSGYLFLLLVLLLALIYPIIISSSSLTTPETMILILIIGAAGVLEFFTMAKYRVLLTADQKFYILSIASISTIFLNTGIIAVLALRGFSIVTVRGVALFSVFFRSLILHYYVRNKYKFANYYAPPNNIALQKRWDAFYLQILGGIHNGAPVIIATLFTTLKTVSVYSIFSMVMAGVSGILSVTINGLFASFGDVIARREQGVLQTAYEEFEFIYYMIISVAYGCAAVLLMPFIALYTRGVVDANYYLPIVGYLFVINGLAHNIKTPQGLLVISAGLFRETRRQTTTQGLIAVFGGVVFVQFWGLPGILLGSILSNIYRDIDLLFFIPRYVTKLPIKHSFFRIMRIFISIVLIIIPFYFSPPNPESYLQWTKVALIVMIYATTVVITINFCMEKTVFCRAFKRLCFVLTRS